MIDPKHEGSQFTGSEFIGKLKAHEIAISMDGKRAEAPQPQAAQRFARQQRARRAAAQGGRAGPRFRKAFDSCSARCFATPMR